MRIKLENLKKTYASASRIVNAVNDISLEIPENQVFGIIGKSGAGKSSLVRLISLLETPDQGAIYFNNDRVDNLSKEDLIMRRRKLGMIFQNFNLFTSRTAAKNIAYPMEICGYSKSEIDSRVKEMLALVGLEDRASSPVSTLSGGQKQRIAIARALSTKPDILFCDEATSALDPQTTRSILNLIREIQKKMNLTVVMITHQMEVVRDACDQVAVIDAGQVVEKGSVVDIFSSPKSSVTKDFLSHLIPEDLNKSDEEFACWSKEGGKYTLYFEGKKTGEPILSQLAKKIDIEFNIRAGGITYLAKEEVGKMIVDFIGKKEEIEKGILYLKENGVRVEEEK